MLELFVFLFGSIGITVISHQSLVSHTSHGFPRFFAFEALLGLVVLNAHSWFTRPFSILQILSWALLLDAAYLATHAIWTLRVQGHPDRTIQDASRFSFEKTTKLVTQGPYQFIRHPMYTSLLELTWGVFLKEIDLLSVLLTILVSLTLFLTAVYEERENLRNFGDEYATYMQRTKRFIPFVY